MSKGNLAIKVLRENFIRKHQVHPDYFTQGERAIDEEAFCDREMYYPREYQRKNNHQGHGRLVPANHEQVRQVASLKLHTRAKQTPTLRIAPKSVTPALTVRGEDRHVVVYSTLPNQPSFVKAEKLRRKVESAREGRRPMPRYSAYIMKPCSVAAARMEPRPQSAFTRRKSQQLNKYMGFGLKQREQSEKLKPAKHYLMPWETDYDEL